MHRLDTIISDLIPFPQTSIIFKGLHSARNRVERLNPD